MIDRRFRRQGVVLKDTRPTTEKTVTIERRVAPMHVREGDEP